MRPPSRDVTLRYAAAALSGGMLQFVSPPYGMAWLHWFSFVPFLAVLGRSDRKHDFRLGYTCGVIGIFFLFFWLARTIDTFSNIPLPVAALVVVLFAAVWGLPYGVLAMIVPALQRRFGSLWVWIFPACWVAGEFVQPALFPYYQGVGQYRQRYVWQLASVFGCYGVTGLVILTNCAIAEVIRSRSFRHLGLAALVWLANLGFGYWRYHAVHDALAAADTPVVRAGIVQQHVTMVTRLQDRGSEVLRSWMELTARLLPEHPDLVVWPEGSIYYNPNEGKVKELFSSMTREGGFDFLVGGGTTIRDPDDPKRRKSWNSCYLFGRDGEVRGRYDKMVPLPFGEYLPWPVAFLRPYISGVGNFHAGDAATVFDTGRYTFTTPICYEAILDSQMRTLGDADLYVNITNDGWFGDTPAPHQHAMLAIAHAMEFGRPMLRVAYTGISMVVEPDGDVLFETAPYTDVAAVVPVRVRSFDTPYRTWGRVFPWLCLAGAASAIVAARRQFVTSSASAA